MRKLPQNMNEAGQSYTKQAPEELYTQPINRFETLANTVPHESAKNHVTGQSMYVDDAAKAHHTLYVAAGCSEFAHAKIVSIDIEAVRKAPGVVDVIVHDDIPGNPDVAPVFHGDLLLAKDEVVFMGQPIFAVAATSQRAAKQAVKLAKIEYQELDAVLTPEQSLQHQDFVLPTHTITMGDVESQAKLAHHTVKNTLYVRGQEHFYLEGHVSMATPQEDGGMKVLASSQHPAEVQKLVASVLGVPLHLVEVDVKRMGGGFGGKESQAAAVACMAAVLAQRTSSVTVYRMARQDDMTQTGKRHDFWNQYQISFNNDGKIQGFNAELAGLCGHSADLSDGVVDRAMFHSDNAYFLNSAKVVGYRCKTNTVSNTAFRGFGGPKGVITIESAMDDIARKLKIDPLDARKINLYQGKNNTTHYGQTLEESVLPELINTLEDSSNYRSRRQAINEFNRTNTQLKKGLALTPVKFGISFTTQHLNQGGALVHIYLDGSVYVSHGGTEMGQGLNTKIKLLAARAMGVGADRVRVGVTGTDKVANASPTAASAGTDLNGMAALNAIARIKKGLFEFAEKHYGVNRDLICIEDDHLVVGEQRVAFPEFIKLAYLNRIPLSSHGYYRTPKIFYDRKNAKGQPFYYFANGAAASEVIVDTLTGEYKVTRVDILHDVGRSINPAIDIGQIEGGFIQGMGWLTTEELLWNEQGKIISNSPANYKIPTSTDTPEVFNVALFDRPNHVDNTYYSKAVGEPPLMLAISVWCALRDACASLADYQFNPPLAAPATPEQVFKCLNAAKAFSTKHAKTELADETR